MSTLSSKIIAASALLLLIGAPLGSYFYLNSGYNYRLETLAELKVKGEVQPFNIVIDSLNGFQDEDLKGKVTVLSNLLKSGEDQFLTDVHDQFAEREEFQMVSFGGVNESGKSDKWTIIENQGAMTDAFVKDLTGGIFELERPYHILIDTALGIRNIYQGNDETSLIQLVEHIAIILPRTKRSDIVHKNSIDEE